jgi:hypothetical protein
MEAELSKDSSPPARVFRKLERSFSRTFFVRAFLKGDYAGAEKVGVPVSERDKLLFGATLALVSGQMLGYRVAAKLPLVRDVADAHLIARLKRQLASYGHAEFTTNAAEYRQVAA